MSTIPRNANPGATTIPTTVEEPSGGGKLIVLTAPLTEAIDPPVTSRTARHS